MTLALPSKRDEGWRYSDFAALAEFWPVAAPERSLVPAGERAAGHLIQTAAEDAVAVCDYVIEIEDGARLDFHILNMGGKLGRMSLDVTLGEGAHFELGGAILGHGSTRLNSSH